MFKTKGGGGQRLFEQCLKKTADLAEVGSPYHPHHHHSHPHNPHHDNDQRVLYYLDNRRLKYTEDSSCTTIMIRAD